MTGRGRFPILLAAVLLWATGAVGADESDRALLAQMCAACHGPDGRSPGPVPGLASLNEQAIRALLLAFRNAETEATVMDRIARALTDGEIESLARHFGRLAE